MIWVIQSRLEISFIIQHFALALSIVIVGYNIKFTKKSILCGGGFSLIFTAAMLLMSLIYFTFGTQGFIIFLDGMFAIISAIFIFFGNKYRRDTKYYLWLELFGIMVTITQIIGQLSFLGSHFNVSDGVLWALRSFGSALIVPCAVFIKYFSIEKFKHTSANLLVLLGIITLISFGLHLYISLFALSLNSNVAYIVNELICFAGLLVIEMLFCFMLHNTCKAQEIAFDEQAKSLDSKRISELILISDKNIENIREVNHDIKNHFAYIKLLADKVGNNEISDYLKDLTFDFLSNSLIDCGNKIISSIINLECIKAAKMGVSISRQIIVPPQLPFRESDLCALLMNIIDNAIEGCLSGDMSKEVSIEIFTKNEELIICVSNPTDKPPEFIEKMSTTKPDSVSHGYGMKIIDKLMKKYNGFYNCSISNGIFTFEGSLSLEYTSE